MEKQFTSIDQFIAKNFKNNCSDYIVIEAKILNSFLNRLVNIGFNLVSANDGEERHKIEGSDRFAMLDVIFSVDESSITLVSNKNERFALSLVLGNGEGNPINDHSDLSDELEKTIYSEFAKSVKSHSLSLYEANWTGYAC